MSTSQTHWMDAARARIRESSPALDQAVRAMYEAMPNSTRDHEPLAVLIDNQKSALTVYVLVPGLLYEARGPVSPPPDPPTQEWTSRCEVSVNAITPEWRSGLSIECRYVQGALMTKHVWSLGRGQGAGISLEVEGGADPASDADQEKLVFGSRFALEVARIRSEHAA